MRRTVIIMAVATAVSFLGIVAIPGSPGGPCTRIGTPGRDIISGTAAHDVICAEAGRDYVHGKAGADVLRGGPSRDVLVGGRGRDKEFGDAGADRLFLIDGAPGGVANGGPGFDQCFIDPGDRVTSCEEVFTSQDPISARRLSGSFGGAVALAQSLITTPAPTIPPPPAPTSATHPPCTPPPATPPPNC